MYKIKEEILYLNKSTEEKRKQLNDEEYDTQKLG